MRFLVFLLLISIGLLSFCQMDSVFYKWNVRAGSYFNPKTPPYQNYYPIYLEMNRNIDNKQWCGIRFSYLPKVNQGHIYNRFNQINEEYNGVIYTELIHFVNKGWAIGLEPNYSLHFRLIRNYVYCYLSSGLGIHLLNNSCIDNTNNNIAYGSLSISAGLEIRLNHFAIACEPFNNTLILLPGFGNGSCYGSINFSYYFNINQKK